MTNTTDRRQYLAGDPLPRRPWTETLRTWGYDPKDVRYVTIGPHGINVTTAHPDGGELTTLHRFEGQR